ncbi:uncharacterized protein LOC111477620 [Cucurbita maxima]|uniref:Uncharacterized protein LOC111477620 n=1 Tax=Cucurbita maxima TaxID=3661 RepID=A0A6J1IHY2_CUCMA|nr:uncharacterized protein LOC111477620 [Cucurbita maxima]
MEDDPSASYIHMVHHLIEQCIVFNMNKEECMEALSKHANIKPVITSTVWNELEKENKEFFEAYKKKRRDVTTRAADGTSSDTSDFNLLDSGDTTSGR